jgi:hypothetical protein
VPNKGFLLADLLGVCLWFGLLVFFPFGFVVSSFLAVCLSSVFLSFGSFLAQLSLAPFFS